MDRPQTDIPPHCRDRLEYSPRSLGLGGSCDESEGGSSMDLHHQTKTGWCDQQGLKGRDKVRLRVTRTQDQLTSCDSEPAVFKAIPKSPRSQETYRQDHFMVSH